MSISALVVDRIEGDLAVVQSADGASYTISVGLLPDGAREGSWLRMQLELDPEGTRAASERVAALRAELIEEDDGGDFAL